jgi:hypothetical protein
MAKWRNGEMAKRTLMPACGGDVNRRGRLTNYTHTPMSKRTQKKRNRARKKKANHGKKPNCGRG